MKKITVSVDDETHRLVKMKAAEMETSVSGLVRDYLTNLTKGGTEEAAMRGEEPEKTLGEIISAIFTRGRGLDPRDNLTREELHDRNAFR
jgi:plasmid stability protein